MLKVGIIGSPGAGKSTTSAGLFYKLKQNGYTAELVHEFAREDINRGWKYEHPAEQLRILMHQKEYENIIPKEINVMITDSPTILTYFYALWNTEYPKENILTLKDLYELFLEDIERYDVLIFMNRVKKYVQDGTRIQTEEDSDKISQQLKALLDLHHVKYYEYDGNEDAVDNIYDAIKSRIYKPKILKLVEAREVACD